MKIDVEGYEVDVLRGLESIFELGFRPVVIVELHTLLDPTGPQYVAEFCSRHKLRAAWLVDDDSPLTSRLQARRELPPPIDLASIPRDRFDLLLSG